MKTYNEFIVEKINFSEEILSLNESYITELTPDQERQIDEAIDRFVSDLQAAELLPTPKSLATTHRPRVGKSTLLPCQLHRWCRFVVHQRQGGLHPTQPRLRIPY